MDRSAVKAIVDREIEPLMRRLGIPHWKIRVTLDPREPRENGDTQRGIVEYRVDYNTAVINLNPDSFDDETEVIETLRHELQHIVASPYAIVYGMLRSLLDNEPKVWALIDSAWTHANEQTVINLERMYLGLTNEADPMAKKPKPKPMPMPKPGKPGKPR